MEKNKEAKQRILSEAIVYTDAQKLRESRGQHHNGPAPPGVKVWHPIGVSIYINSSRSAIKNMELAMTLFELALDDVLQ